MVKRKIFAGAKLKQLREREHLTQADLARRLEVSTSYVNQIENNQRPLTASIMLALSETLALDLSALASDNSDRLLAGLREAIGDPVFGDAAPGLQELKGVATTAPEVARAMLRLYDAYRKTNERLTDLDDVLVRETGGQLQTAYEEVRDFFHYGDNYIDDLDRAAERVGDQIAPADRSRVERLVAYLRDNHQVRVSFVSLDDPEMLRQFDGATRHLLINARTDPPTQFFQMANQLALLDQRRLIDSILDGARFKTADARHICQIGLANYYAGAVQMPYGAFLAAARANRHDLDELAHGFGASLEQVAHRLSTMQRPTARGLPFFFARVDRAGTITKRHSATPLQFARFGGACPLWNVYRAFEENGRIIRQFAETPDGHRYLCLAWSTEKRSGGFRGPVRRYAYALGCEIAFAPQLVYADSLDDVSTQLFEPIGVSCRICERRNCPQRSVPPIAAAITVPSDHRAIVPYEIL